MKKIIPILVSMAFLANPAFCSPNGSCIASGLFGLVSGLAIGTSIQQPVQVQEVTYIQQPIATPVVQTSTYTYPNSIVVVQQPVQTVVQPVVVRPVYVPPPPRPMYVPPPHRHPPMIHHRPPPNRILPPPPPRRPPPPRFHR